MKKLLLLALIGTCFEMKSLYYMNEEPISFRSIFTGKNCTSIDYNITNDGNGSVGGYKRLFGVHDMFISIPGYEPVYLIQEDVCFYPHLFTMLWFLGKNNPLVQRFACVKWWLPLSFSFKVQNDTLTIQSSIWKYRYLAPFRATAKISLIKVLLSSETQNKSLDKNLPITVSVNGRTALVDQKTILQIYSLSAQQAAIIPYFLWPLL